MPRVILDGARAPELLADMESAARAFIEQVDRPGDHWTRAARGKWSVGQHAEHLALVYAAAADRFESAAAALAAGTLAPRPRRGIAQRLFVNLLAQSAKFPRGGKAVAATTPDADPDRSTTLARLRGEVARYRPLVERHPASDLDRLWIANPYTTFRWHYILPEMLRIHAQHTRHHAMLAEEVAR